MTRLPPALVERFPPIGEEPRDPRSSGKKNPASSAAFWIVSSGVPALTVMVALARSISSMPTMRSNEIATQPGSGAAPPHRPVSPPWGTNGSPTLRHAAIASDTPVASSGRTTAIGVRGKLALQSLQLRAGTSAPISTACGPSLSRKAPSGPSGRSDSVVAAMRRRVFARFLQSAVRFWQGSLRHKGVELMLYVRYKASQAYSMKRSRHLVGARGDVMTGPIRGFWAATPTPLTVEGSVDHAKLAGHAHGLFKRGIDGVVLFGTTGEGTTFNVAERVATVEALLKAGVPASRIGIGGGFPAITDSIALTRSVLSLGVNHVLILPPYFDRSVTPAGIEDAFSAIFDAVADKRLRAPLYHIPPVSGVGVP